MRDHPWQPGSNSSVMVPVNRIPVSRSCGISDQVGSRYAHLPPVWAPVVLRRWFQPLADFVGFGKWRDQEQ